jgi:hypothetical protein
MKRRTFLQGSLLAAGPLLLTPNGSSADEPAMASILQGQPVVTGPAGDSITLLQAVTAPATGYAEISVDGADWTRVNAEAAGLLPYDDAVLKFLLPKLPAGKTVKYRLHVTPIDFKSAYKIVRLDPVTTPELSFKTLDPAAEETRFIIWNDTHENQETISQLVKRTSEQAPDFLLWNGDQTNDIYDVRKMANQYLCPGGMAVSAAWPLAYARGNHDVRGPAARHLTRFTGTPDDHFYYAFRSGPVAALVLDTGEDKPDDHPVFAGLADFATMRQRQAEWLASAIELDWFKSAPHKVLFCHIPLYWKDESRSGPPWTFSKVCRDAWLPALLKGGVKLIVSGHTHEHAWLPANSDRPIGQLIGGGPKPAAATFTAGMADSKTLSLTMTNLAGETLYDVTIPA